MVDESKDKDAAPNLWQIIGSVLAAGFGVQSERNRQRDFAAGSAKAYVIVGLIGTILFILVLYGIVKLVLGAAGA